MKSKSLILIVVLLLIPIMVMAVSVNLAIKMGPGCPFKPGPKINRCNPGVIHSNENSIELIGMAMPLSQLYSPLLSFLNDQVNSDVTAFALDSRNSLPLRC